MTAHPSVTAGRGEGPAAAALLSPALLLLIGLHLLPAAAVIGIAFTDYQLGAPGLSFAGLDNFRALAADPAIRAALRNSLVFIAWTVPATVAAGLALALLIEAGRAGRTLYSTLHFLPFMATLAAMAIAWEALLHPTIGLVNQALRMAGFAGTTNWLREEATALPTLAVLFVWQHAGFAMVLFLAGLRAIPRDLYEAAAVDGVDSALGRLRTVTLPLLRPVMAFILIVMSLRALEVFDTVRVLTEGGPAKSSEMLLHSLYVEAFEYLNTGRGAAIAVVFLAITVALTLLQARVLDRRSHDA